MHVPRLRLDPAAIRAAMINEAAPENPGDDFYGNAPAPLPLFPNLRSGRCQESLQHDHPRQDRKKRHTLRFHFINSAKYALRQQDCVSFPLTS